LPLVPDTGVTIKNMADSLSAAIQTLVGNGLRWQRSVCVAESRPASPMTILPRHRRWMWQLRGILPR
jgi:hypothetical protein